MAQEKILFTFDLASVICGLDNKSALDYMAAKVGASPLELTDLLIQASAACLKLEKSVEDFRDLYTEKEKTFRNGSNDQAGEIEALTKKTKKT